MKLLLKKRRKEEKKKRRKEEKKKFYALRTYGFIEFLQVLISILGLFLSKGFS